MDYKVIVSPLARDDLRECFEYIARDNTDAAVRYCNQLLDHAEKIGADPGIGRKCPEFSDESIRDIVFRNHRIVYQVDDTSGTVGIARFWHGARGFFPEDFDE